MKLLLGSLLLAGICWLGATVTIPIMGNFDNERIAKAWYPLLAIATGSRRDSEFYPFKFVAQPNGNLKYIRIPKNGGCSTQGLALNKQGQPGDYATTIPSTLSFVETDYNTYFICYITRGADKAEAFLVLSSTQPTLTPALEAKFRAKATSLGITGEVFHIVLQASC